MIDALAQNPMKEVNSNTWLMVGSVFRAKVEQKFLTERLNQREYVTLVIRAGSTLKATHQIPNLQDGKHELNFAIGLDPQVAQQIDRSSSINVRDI